MSVQSTTKKRPLWLIIVAVLAGVCVLCVAASLVMNTMGLLPETTSIPTNLPPSDLPPTEPPATDPPPPTDPSTPSPTQKYLDEYGGKIEVYEEIFSLTDCTVLQARFETAYENNQRETPGTALFKITLGYMTATDDHMRTIGCYSN